MRVSLKMLLPRSYGRVMAQAYPNEWKTFKKIAGDYMGTSEREVRVGWHWFMNGVVSEKKRVREQ